VPATPILCLEKWIVSFPAAESLERPDDLTRMKIRRTATALGLAMTGLGMACGVLYSVGGFFFDLFTTGLNGGTAMAFGALVGMPIIFGTFGFLFGALVAVVVSGAGALRQRLRR